MRYTTIVAAALAGTAVAQVPACASGPVNDALTTIGGPANIQKLCTNQGGVLDKLTAALVAACSCADLNTAIGLAGTFCPNLNIPKRDCSASSAPVSSVPVSSTPASVAPVTTVSASTTAVVSTTITVSSVSSAPTHSSNGTIVTPPPASTSIAVGAGSAVQVGGVAMIGAFFAALAL